MDVSMISTASRKALSCALVLACLSIVNVARADVSAGPTTVTKYYVYTDFGGGDVAFWVAGAMPAGCAAGFWLPASAAGFKSEVAALMVAYATGLPLIIYADATVSWSGSSPGQFCRVTSLGPS